MSFDTTSKDHFEGELHSNAIVEKELKEMEFVPDGPNICGYCGRDNEGDQRLILMECREDFVIAYMGSIFNFCGYACLIKHCSKVEDDDISDVEICSTDEDEESSTDEDEERSTEEKSEPEDKNQTKITDHFNIKNNF